MAELPEPPGPNTTASPLPGASVLLVDDNPANLLALRAILDDLGHTLVDVRSGEEALLRLLRDDFAVVLLDVQMHGMDGFETAKLIRGRERSRHTPIIFMTAYDDDRLSAKEAYKLGAVDYLTKPVEPLILRAKVAGFIDLFRKTEQIKRQAQQLRQRDRTEFEGRLAEENARLQESERRFRTLTRFAPVGIFQTDAGGNCLFVNERWCAMAGLSPEEAQGEGWVGALHPEDRERVALEWAGAAEAGREFASEYRFRTAQGKTTWLHGSAVSLRSDSGQVTGYIGTVTDVTERKLAEEELRRSRGQLSADLSAMSRLHELSTRLLACHHLPDALNEVLDAAIALLGSAFGNVQLHDPKSGTLEMVAHRGFGPDFLDHFRTVRTDDEAACGRAMRGGERVVIEDVQTDPAFEPHREVAAAAGYRAVQSTPLWSRTGELLGMLSTHFRQPHRPSERDLRVLDLYARQAADFIERLRAEDLLREADRRKDEFLATLAHELRNPLAPIRNSLQILKMPRVDAVMAQQTRDMMERQVNHLVRLVDDLLDVSRVMRGKVELRKEPVELATVVARAVETAKPLIEVQGHRLEISLPPDSLLLDADPVRLAQVVGNLLTNSAKYTEANGHIRLSAEREGDQAVLRVWDNGIGIASDMLPHVFDLFVQADHASTKAQGGLGVGLTLVKNLVGLHGGTVEAKSSGLGRGCEFVVRLPLVVHGSSPVQSHGDTVTQAQQPPLPSGKRLLVVDDNTDAADSLAMLLRLQGHEVRVAHGGQAALEVTKTFKPDLIFLDIGMPVMDGYEVARRMRTTPGLGNVVLAALTGWGQQEDRRRTADAGFDHHLVKPPDPKELESVLAELKRLDRQ
jgi:PAS domain S-box-containing protein